MGEGEPSRLLSALKELKAMKPAELAPEALEERMYRRQRGQ